jgi:hypothetical protein
MFRSFGAFGSSIKTRSYKHFAPNGTMTIVGGER